MCLFCNERERGKSQDTQDSPVCSGIKRTPNPALFVTTGLREEVIHIIYVNFSLILHVVLVYRQYNIVIAKNINLEI